jgi:hypothetical protein
MEFVTYVVGLATGIVFGMEFLIFLAKGEQ